MVELSQTCSLQDSGRWYFSVNRRNTTPLQHYTIPNHSYSHTHWLPPWLLPICLPLGRTLINHCRHNQTCWLTTHGCAACVWVCVLHTCGFLCFSCAFVCLRVGGWAARVDTTWLQCGFNEGNGKKAAGVLWCVTNQKGSPIGSHETQLVLFTARPQRVRCLYQGYSYMGRIFVLLSSSKCQINMN